MEEYEVQFDVWMHVRGTAYLDFEPTDPEDLTDYLISDESSYEIDSVTTRPAFCGEGYMRVEKCSEDEEEEE